MFTISSLSASDPFGAVKLVCKVLGVHSYEKNSSSSNFSVFLNIVFIIVLFALVLPCLAFFLHNLSDVNNAAEVLSILFPATLHLGQYFILVSTKPHLAALFREFEDLIQSSA